MGELVVSEIDAIAAGIDHSQAGLLGPKLVGKLPAGNPVRHDHVGQKEINLVGVLGPNAQGLRAAGGVDYSVTALFQNERGEVSERSFIFHQQDGFMARLRLAIRVTPDAARRRVLGAGNINVET